MLPEDTRSSAVPAISLPEPPKRGKVQSDNQDGPERFARWFPLLQKIRRGYAEQLNPVIPQALLDKIQESDFPPWMPKDSDKIFVNKLVPCHEYPAAQLRNGILTPQLSRPPKNLKRLQMRLLQPRVDSDWTFEAWQKYRACPQFRRHRDLTRVGMRYLFKTFQEQPGYQRAYYQRWYDFPEYAPFAQGLEQPCPGFVQGFAFEAYNFDIKYVGAAVCYASCGHSLTLPHMAGEFAVGALEAEEATDARHGAALVYMRKAALLHAEIRKDPDDVAVIMTFISDGLHIRFYAHYESRSPDGRVEYHQYPIMAANLAASYDEFLRGVAMLRNCQDVAFVLAKGTKNRLERYHAANGINAWAYHLDDSEAILSESEDSVIEGAGQRDEIQQEEQDTQSKEDVINKPKETAHEKDEVKAGASDAHEEKKEDATSPTTRVLRPRKPAAQEEKPAPRPRKRKASQAIGDADKKHPSKRPRS
ncbi:hypothetical protein ACQKWADRAFT_288778 [Trichoderma austrokoningii]